MFTSGTGNEILNLYYSDSLDSGWEPHPLNSIIENNAHFACPARKVIEFKDLIYRIAQDDYPNYGIQVYAIEISELFRTTYMEKIDTTRVIVTKTCKGWNSEGMHHVGRIKEGDAWLAAIEGVKRRK